MASIATVAIWAFAIIIAANQIGIAQTLVNTLFMGTVAMLVLALGLAFGLGGRDTAGQIVQSWYESLQANKPKLERAANETAQTTKAHLERSDLEETVSRTLDTPRKARP